MSNTPTSTCSTPLGLPQGIAKGLMTVALFASTLNAQKPCRPSWDNPPSGMDEGNQLLKLPKRPPGSAS